MKLGINSSIWEIGGVNFSDAIDRISRAGFRYVDVLALGSVDPTKMEAKTRKRLIRKFKDSGLVASNMVILPPGNISSNLEEEREKCLAFLKRCAEFQRELGGKQILLGFGGGFLSLKLSRERAWVNSVEFIRDLCEWLSEMRMFLTLELDPFVFHVVNDTTSMARIISDVNMNNLFANVDLGHLAITREPPAALEKLRGKILHVHLSDNNGSIHANYILGKGVTLFPEYIKKLIEMKVDETCRQYKEVAVAAMELGEMGQDIADPDRYVRESLEYIERNIPELRR